MEYICEKAKERLVLEPEDYPGDEWTTILKIFGMEEAERIVISDYKFEAYGKVRPKIMRRSGRYPWRCDHDPLPFFDPEPYKPVCPRGYTDCVCDPAYIKYHHPEWYKEMYGDLSPEEAARTEDSCYDRFRKDPDEKYYCYDDEDK